MWKGRSRGTGVRLPSLQLDRTSLFFYLMLSTMCQAVLSVQSCMYFVIFDAILRCIFKVSKPFIANVWKYSWLLLFTLSPYNPAQQLMLALVALLQIPLDLLHKSCHLQIKAVYLFILWMLFTSSVFLLSLASSTTLKRNSDSGYSCLVPHVTERIQSFPLHPILAVSFLVDL